MKEFFSVKRLTAFDWLTVYFICRAAEVYWAWFLLIIPQMFLSMFLAEYFLKKEDQQNEKGNTHL